MTIAVPLTLLLGLLCGLVNAALIHYTGISPLVITLGTLYLYGGGALLLSGMAGATGYEGIGGFPDSFTAFANLTVLGLPIPLVLFAVITVFFWLITHRGRFGRHLFLIGQNPRAALCGAVGERHALRAVRPGGRGLGDCRAGDGLLFRLRTFGSGARSINACAHRRRARRSQYLRRVRFCCRYGAGGAAGGVPATGFTDGRHPQPVSSALSGALLVVVVMGRSLSLHREWVRSLFRKLSGA